MKMIISLLLAVWGTAVVCAQETRIVSFTDQTLTWTNEQTGGYSTIDFTWSLTGGWYHLYGPYWNIPVTDSTMAVDMPIREFDLTALTNLTGAPVAGLFFRISSTTNPIPTPVWTNPVMFVNSSTSDVVNLQMRIIGGTTSEGAQWLTVTNIPPGTNTLFYDFLLPWYMGGAIPLSYGDLMGSYTQTGQGKSIYIFYHGPRTNIIRINDVSYTVD